MATINDVAKRAGISRSTVSLVLNNSSLVNENTREKVLEVIKEMGYVPNSNARGLSGKSMNSLGVIMLTDQQHKDCYEYDHSTGLTSQNILDGIMQGIADTEYSLLYEKICLTGHDDIPKLVRNRRIDGAFIVGGSYNEAFIDKMKQTGIPFVIAGFGSKEEGIDSVLIDYNEGIYLSAKYLIEKGHKKICFLNSPRSFFSYKARVAGMERAVKELNFDFDWNWMLNCERNSGRDGYITLKHFWEKGGRPDSILAGNSNVALGVVRYLSEKKVNIPEDISLFAFEDSVLCGYATPALTAANIQKENIGRRAAELLLDRMADPGKEVGSIDIMPYIVERDSVVQR